MPFQSWQQTIIGEQSDGTAVTATAEGSLLPAQAKVTVPANFFGFIGQKFRIRAAGRISNIVTTPGTLTLRFRLGGISGAIVGASQGMQLNAVAKTNVTWVLDWAFTMRVVGAAANAMHTGAWQSESVVGSGTGAAGSTGPGQFLIPASAPAVGANFDATVAQVAEFTAQFSLTGNSIQLHQYALESMN